jgi:hypothetical protein
MVRQLDHLDNRHPGAAEMEAFVDQCLPYRQLNS